MQRRLFTVRALLVLTMAVGAWAQTPTLTPDVGGPLSDAELNYPARLAPDGGGGIYVTDPVGGKVVKFGVSTTVFTVDDGAGNPQQPVGIAVNGADVYLSTLDGQVGVYAEVDDVLVRQAALDPAPATLIQPNDLAISPMKRAILAVAS